MFLSSLTIRERFSVAITFSSRRFKWNVLFFVPNTKNLHTSIVPRPRCVTVQMGNILTYDSQWSVSNTKISFSFLFGQMGPNEPDKGRLAKRPFSSLSFLQTPPCNPIKFQTGAKSDTPSDKPECQFDLNGQNLGT